MSCWTKNLGWKGEVVLTAIIAGGCAPERGPSLTFKVIDSETSEPLAGVRVHEEGSWQNWMGGAIISYEHSSLSDSEGMVHSQAICTDMGNRYGFSKAYYLPSHALLGRSHDSHLSLMAPSMDFECQPTTRAVSIDRLEPIIIPMVRRKGN